MRTGGDGRGRRAVTLNKRGATRFVILTRRYAIKIPRFWGHNPHGRLVAIDYGS